MSVNLYVDIGGNLVLGRIIQSVYFYPTAPSVKITYLSGRTVTLPTKGILSVETVDGEKIYNLDFDKITSILDEISKIHAEPCYPSDSDESGCPLGMANL